MDVSVAVIHLEQSSLSEHSRFNPAEYNVLLVPDCGPVASTSRFVDPLQMEEPLRQIDGKSLNRPIDPLDRSVVDYTLCLPRCRLGEAEMESEAALRLARSMVAVGGGEKSSHRLRRAVQVAQWKWNRAAAGSRHFGSLYCIPVLESDKFLVAQCCCGHFENLAKLLILCESSTESIEAETRHLLLTLEEWLCEQRRKRPQFLTNLFSRAAALRRLRLCAHNPAYDPTESKCCHLYEKTSKIEQKNTKNLSPLCNAVSRRSLGNSELAEEVRRGNDARAKMIFFEKYDVFIMNPLFGAGLCYNSKDNGPTYFVKGRRWARNRPEQPQMGVCSGNGWSEQYPVHWATYLGQTDILRSLLAQGHDPNRSDPDSWMPLHYAAWYGRLQAMQILLNFGNCDVNLRNKRGATPLHFAAWYGNTYMVELLLSHPSIIADAKDNDDKTPLDLCECIPKAEWQAVARLLETQTVHKLAKVQIDLMDGTNVMVSLLNGLETTSVQLQQQVGDELRLSQSCSRLFSLWICSDSLELQLKSDHKPILHMQKWTKKIVPKWSDSADPSKEEPKLVFRRDARATLDNEKQARLTDGALGLLYEEARYNYMRGRYPCSDQDITTLAAIMMQILYGDYDSTRDKTHLANEKSLRMLLPLHRLSASRALLPKILHEHKIISAKAARFVTGLQYQFLSFCWNLCVYGSTFFDALVFMSKPVKGNLQVHVGVNDCGMHLINSETKTLFQTYALETLEWTYKADHPYLQMKARQPALHLFTLRTRQASHLNILLCKLLETGDSCSDDRRTSQSDRGS